MSVSLILFFIANCTRTLWSSLPLREYGTSSISNSTASLSKSAPEVTSSLSSLTLLCVCFSIRHDSALEMNPSIRRNSSTSLTFRFIFRRELPENITIFHIIRMRNTPEIRSVSPVVRHHGSLILTTTLTGGVVHLPGYMDACTSTI